jgi:hypothetical protein
METVKKTKAYSIFKKRNGRFTIEGKKGKTINGAEKVKILVAEGLIKLTAKSNKPAATEEA